MKTRCCRFLLPILDSRRVPIECGEPAQWQRKLFGEPRSYCDDHKQFLKTMDLAQEGDFERIEP